MQNLTDIGPIRLVADSSLRPRGESQASLGEPEAPQELEGYALTWDALSETRDGIDDLGEYRIVLREHEPQLADDLYLLWQHDHGTMPLAGTRNGTLAATADSRGLRVVARLDDSSMGRDLAIKVRDGLITGMSAEVRPLAYGWEEDEQGGRLLAIYSSLIGEVTATHIPAVADSWLRVRASTSLPTATQQVAAEYRDRGRDQLSMARMGQTGETMPAKTDKQIKDIDPVKLSNDELAETAEQLVEVEGVKLSAASDDDAESIAAVEEITKLRAQLKAELSRRLDNAREAVQLGKAQTSPDIVARLNAKSDGDATEAQRKAFDRYLLSGERGPQLLSVTTATASGVLVPEVVREGHVVRETSNALRKVLNAYGRPTLRDTQTQIHKLPVFDFTGNAGRAPVEGETQYNLDGSADSDPALDKSLILDGTKMYASGQTWLSYGSLHANSLNIGEYVLSGGRNVIDRRQESDWLTSIIAAAVAAGRVVECAVSGASYDNVIDLEEGVDDGYKDSMAIIGSSAFAAQTRKLSDGAGPMFERNPANDWMDSVHGLPFFRSQSLSGFGANNVVAVAISADALKILDAGGGEIVERYDRNPLRPLHAGFEVYRFGDADAVLNGVTVLKCAAS